MADQPELTTAEREMKRRGRRRLMGAVTLGLLAFVFVPMFFDDAPKQGSGKPRTEISVQIPQKEGQPALPAPTSNVPLPPSPVSADSQKTSPEPVRVQIPPVEPVKEPPKESTKESLKEAVKEAPKAEPKVSVPQRETKPAAAEKTPETKAVAKTAKEPIAKGAFVVQVGAFSDAEKIKESVARIKDAGLPHYTETVAVSGGKVTRVRAGPFETKHAAEAALAKIKLAGGDGKIVPR